MLLRNCDVFHLKFRHKETQCNILFNNRRCFYNQLLSDFILYGNNINILCIRSELD